MITKGGMATGLLSPGVAVKASVHWFPDPGWTAGVEAGPRSLLAYRVLGRPGGPIHVLMIEDDAAIAEMYRIQFEHDGHRVTIATTGEIAFSTLSEAAPDLVLLDLLLPDLSGFDVLDTLNDRLPNHPPVVILSNYGEPSMIDRGRSLGAIEYLVKSRVTPADISRQIPGWVEERPRGGQPES